MLFKLILSEKNFLHVTIQKFLCDPVKISMGTYIVQLFNGGVSEISSIEAVELGTVNLLNNHVSIIIRSDDNIAGPEIRQHIIQALHTRQPRSYTGRMLNLHNSRHEKAARVSEPTRPYLAFSCLFAVSSLAILANSICGLIIR